MAKNEQKTVRIGFELTDEEARKLCDIRAEKKPSTAAAQVVRLVLRNTPFKDMAR